MRVPNMLGTQQTNRAVLGVFQHSGNPPTPRGPSLRHQVAVSVSSASAQKQAGHQVQASDVSHFLLYCFHRTAIQKNCGRIFPTNLRAGGVKSRVLLQARRAAACSFRCSSRAGQLCRPVLGGPGPHSRKTAWYAGPLAFCRA